MQELQAHIPHPVLRPYVEGVYGYRISGLPPGVHVGMPSTTLTVVIPLGEPLRVQRANCSDSVPYDAVVAGLHLAPAQIPHNGHQFGIQLALHPPAARVLFGMPSAEIGGQSVELSDLIGPAADQLLSRLRGAADWSSRFAVLDEGLCRLLNDGGRNAAADVAESWRLAAYGRDLSVAVIAGRVGWSERTLQKRFRAEYGLTPGEVIQVRRFQHSAALVANPRLTLAEAAVRAGYADQPHMTRAWQRFAGVSPGRWRHEDTLAFESNQT